MATRKLDGFTTYGTSTASALVAQWVAQGGTIQPTGGRGGRGAMRIPGDNITPSRILVGVNATTLFLACAIIFESNIPSGNTASHISFNDSANNENLTIMFNSDGSISALRGSRTGTILGTSAAAIFGADSFFYLEVKGFADNTNGTVEIRVNGSTVLNLSGVDTVNTANVEFSQVAFSNRASGGSSYRVSDMHIFDDTGASQNDFLGDYSVIEDVVDADGALNDWTPSSGSDAFAMCDDIPQDGDTTYIEASTVTDRQSMSFPALPGGFTGVQVVELFHISRKDGPGAGAIETFALSNAVEGAGDDDALSESYQGYSSYFPNDPDTSLPWTVARANAVEVILERSA